MMDRRSCGFGVILLLLVWSRPAATLAQRSLQRTTPSAQFSVDDRNKLFQQALALLPEEKVPVQFRGHIAEDLQFRCATMIVAQIQENYDLFSPEQQAVLASILQRPRLPQSIVSPTGRFRVHYITSGVDSVSITDGDSDGVPDFVHETALAFEKAFDVQTRDLGYRTPPDDNGDDGPEYDVYIQDLGTQFYGFTQTDGDVPDTPENDKRSFIVIDNDFNNGHFTTGLPGALVTAAHEFFHAVQFGYRSFSNSDERFYYELCSVWMEDVIYDDINDYYQYIPFYFSATHLPFDKFTFRSFGEAIWNHFLVKKYGDASMIRRSWELMRDGFTAMQAVEQSLQEIGSSFAEEFAEFGVWNYFTDSRADTVTYYEEGNQYNAIKLNGDFVVSEDTSIVDSTLSSTHKYFAFTLQNPGNYSITGTLQDPVSWLFAVLTMPPGQKAELHIFNLVNGINLGELPALSRIVVIAANVEVLDGEDLPSLLTKRLSFRLNLKLGPVDFIGDTGITAIYPNPMNISSNQKVSVVLNLPAVESSDLKIFTSDGRIIRSAKLGRGQTVFTWNGRNDDGDLVASGIYILQLKQGEFIVTRKFAVVR
ncbi:MAG: T9SS type A sorting domain-containing protein [bacterium]